MPDHKYHTASKAAVNKIVQLLNHIHPIEAGLSQAIAQHFVALDLAKGDMLINEGDTCQYMYYIVKGALMAHSTHKKKKIITYISIENEFVSSISGMHGERPTKEGIIAVEPTSLLAFPNNMLLQLFEQYFSLNYVFRIMVQQYYQDAQERSHIIRIGNARERYQYFLKTKPGYINRLPLEHIASLLDMKPQTLAKIRKEDELNMKKIEETETLCAKLELLLIRDEVFRRQELNLNMLAGEMGISAHRLSSLLNNQYKQNFADVISKHRIGSILHQLKQPAAMQHITIEAMAYNAGFASRSAFYAAFKKVTGASPLEFTQQLSLS